MKIPSIFSLAIGLCLISHAPVTAQVPQAVQQTITLSDGSQIKGKLIAIEDGYYHIKTPHLGIVKVEQSQVCEIVSGPVRPAQSLGQMPTPFDDPVLGAKIPGSEMQLNTFYDQLLSDPSIKAEIEAIVADPEIEKLLNNQDLLQAAFSMNPKTIQNNPNAAQLMQHPKIQRLMQIISEKLMSLKGANIR